jgi:hypothetical protein
MSEPDGTAASNRARRHCERARRRNRESEPDGTATSNRARRLCERARRRNRESEPGGAAANERSRQRGRKRSSPAPQRVSRTEPGAALAAGKSEQILPTHPSKLMECQLPKHKRHMDSVNPRVAARESGSTRRDNKQTMLHCYNMLYYVALL